MKKLIKQFLNVKNVKVLGAKIEASNNSIVFKLKPTKGQQCLCPICGKKSEFYDKGRGLRRWRSLDFGTLTAYVESESPMSASESLPLLLRCLNAFESLSVRELNAAIMSRF